MSSPRIVALWVVLVACGSARGVCAQDGQATIARREWLRIAQEAGAAGQHREALEAARAAEAIASTPSLRALIVHEERALGQLVEALADAHRCEADLDAHPDVANRAAIAAVCETAAREIPVLLGRIIVRVTNAPVGVRVSVNGEPVGAEFFDVPHAAMPGSVVVEATAPDGRTARREVLLAAGASIEIPIAFTAAPIPEAPATMQPTPVAAVATRPVWRVSAARIAPGVVGEGVGAAALATAAVAWVVRSAALSALDARCASVDASGLRHCEDTPSARSALADANTWSTAAGVALGIGVAAALAGGLWWLAHRTGAHAPVATATTRVPRTNTQLEVAWHF